jgi:hypothetical protein
MLFFRSEEHLRKWEVFHEKRKGGIIALSDLMRLFSGPYFTNRNRPDYVSHMGEYMADMLSTLETLENAGAYWRLGRLEKLGVSLGRKLGLV